MGGQGGRFLGFLPLGEGKPPGLSRGCGRLVKKPGLKGFTAMRTKDLGLFGLLHRGQLALYRDFARQIELVGVKLKKRERLAHRLCRPRRVRV